MEKHNTKDLIEQTALDLFAKYGYEAVSIRDIGKRVGIKESSIYYHFTNKKAILDSVYDKIDKLIEGMQISFDSAFSKTEEVPEEAMCGVAAAFLRNYFLNPYVHKVILLLSIERNSNEEAERIYQRLLFEMPLLQQEKVFLQMMEKGFIKKNDPAVLAQEYYSIIYFSFQKNCVGENQTEERILLAEKEIRNNIADLYRKMR